MIDTLIFDMGNVIAHYHPDAVIRAICDDPNKIQWVCQHLLENPIWDDFDQGIIEDGALIQTVLDQCDDITMRPLVEYCVTKWQYHNFSINEDILPLIDYGLNHHMDLVLLSNAPWRIHEVVDQVIPHVDRFKAVIFSCDIKLSKPDHKIFEYAVNHLSKMPASCLFIDDRKCNCESAHACGFYTWEYRDHDGRAIIDWLDQVHEQEI